MLPRIPWVRARLFDGESPDDDAGYEFDHSAAKVSNLRGEFYPQIGPLETTWDSVTAFRGGVGQKIPSPVGAWWHVVLVSIIRP